MTLITILEGSFGGPVIYENKEYVSPNTVRAQIKAEEKAKAEARSGAAFNRRVRVKENAISEDPLAVKNVFK